jgi:aspartyl protease family protein
MFIIHHDSSATSRVNRDPSENSAPGGGVRLGRAMTFLAWVLFLLILTWGFGKVYDAQRNPNQRVSGATHADGAHEVRLQRNKFGHYVATGSINGQPVDFLLDTGATGISIPGDIAADLQLQPGRSGRATTAGGDVTVYETRLDSIELGGITLHGVPAHINPHMQDHEILLGMTFLKEVDFAQKGDMLIIRQISR